MGVQLERQGRPPAMPRGVAGMLAQRGRKGAEAEVVRKPGMSGEVPREGVGVGPRAEQ